MLQRNGGTYLQYFRNSPKDLCDIRRKYVYFEVTFSTTTMPAYLQLPGKLTVVNPKDLSDNC